MTAAQKRTAVRHFHIACPDLTSAEICELFSDEYEGSVSESFTRKWWKMESSERKSGSGGHNKVSQNVRKFVVKNCKGFKRKRDGGMFRRDSQRQVVRRLQLEHDVTRIWEVSFGGFGRSVLRGQIWEVSLGGRKNGDGSEE